jgi:hypothetical protein
LEEVPHEIVLTFEAPDDPISMNEGDSWKVRTKSSAWRDAAYYRWCEVHPGEGPSGRAFHTPAVVRVALPFRVQRRRDPINFAKTVKHIVDGLVMAGAWKDDTEEYVEQMIPTLVSGNTVTVRVYVKDEES